METANNKVQEIDVIEMALIVIWALGVIVVSYETFMFLIKNNFIF